MSATAAGASVRAAAARVIRAVHFEGVSLKRALPKALATLADVRDRALCEAITFESARWSLRHEALLKRLLQRPLPGAARDVHALLLAGLAQLDTMQLADYAAISSTAEAARLLNHPHHVGLVNAVLRRFTREREALLRAVEQLDADRHSHPEWMVRMLHRDWGDAAVRVLEQNNLEAPMWLRVNLQRGSVDAYTEALRAAGIAFEPAAFADTALRLRTGIAPRSLPGWSEGQVSVQDLSAQLTVQALAPQRGERVLDACAAPGGKAAHLLECSPDLAQLLALDISAKRLPRMRENFARLGLHAETREGDAGAPDEWWDGTPFDRILLDAPCSGSGVIRRQPDIKLHRRETDIAGLVALQARMLDALWPLLRDGGRLVYATCSVFKDENERQIDAFLARTPTARALPLPEHFGRPGGAGRQRLPGDDQGDGFFHACLVRSG